MLAYCCTTIIFKSVEMTVAFSAVVVVVVVVVVASAVLVLLALTAVAIVARASVVCVPLHHVVLIR